MPDTPELHVPIIDLSTAAADEAVVVQQVAAACSEFGFFQVTHHGIDESLVQAYLDQCRRYFALPHDIKLQWKRSESNSRGYFDDELTKQKRDWKEALDFGVPGSRDWSVPDDNECNKCLDGWNQFPSEDQLPGFRTTVTAYFDACADLADRLAVIMAKGLGVAAAANSPMIRELREHHSSYLRSNYYPPCDDTVQNLGISPHRDAGFLTVLLQDVNTHSLQVWKDGHWITVRPVSGAFTINTGDMAQIYSNGRYKAPLHRVLSNETQARYSAPFFYNPSYQTLVQPLEVLPPQESIESEETTTTISTDAITNKRLYHNCLWGYFRAVRFAGDLTDLGVEIQVEDFMMVNDPPSPHISKQEVFVKEADFGVPFSVEKYRPLLQE